MIIFGQKAEVLRRHLNHENLKESQKLSISGTFRPPYFSGSLECSLLTFSDLLLQINLKNRHSICFNICLGIFGTTRAASLGFDKAKVFIITTFP